MTVCLYSHTDNFGIGCGVVPLASLATHLAAMPRVLGRFEPIGLGAVWRDARRCDRGRVGSIRQGGGLRGFVGMLGSPRGARGRWDLTESASADQAMSVCAPAATYLVVPKDDFEGVSDERLR